MDGYVALEDFSHNEVSQGAVHVTDNHGGHDLPGIAMDEYSLKITAPGHVTYQTDLYIPSDFEYRLAVMLKKKKP